mmetsp:Transcript_36350/g.85299  ORF Transcript_36350/g.85299 Transcript_36350/m.85299 type:complete len:200 (-) Transcript_36350:432-1031(-)
MRLPSLVILGRVGLLLPLVLGRAGVPCDGHGGAEAVGSIVLSSQHLLKQALDIRHRPLLGRELGAKARRHLGLDEAWAERSDYHRRMSLGLLQRIRRQPRLGRAVAAALLGGDLGGLLHDSLGKLLPRGVWAAEELLHLGRLVAQPHGRRARRHVDDAPLGVDEGEESIADALGPEEVDVDHLVEHLLVLAIQPPGPEA